MKKNPNIKKLIREILEKGYVLSLGTGGDGGVWVCDLVCFSDSKLNIYWLSPDITRHSKAIENNPQVAAAISLKNNRGEDNFGLQLSGVASKIDGVRHDLAVMHRRKRGQPLPKKGEDARHGQFWYILKPTMIELINEPLFGFEKKILKLK